ncbi:hypothetical protein KPL78_06090 [Roseomonas sp. HJA6]|uniref:Uncharacterized protein n=1 Tax=Roseomonas alba TaxID=2846776 RepID=A0ABS7A6M0_9PROT|nr:hypothetical protein [Neoroseomonas alba]MBW6397412.1 hypothetical protein [Neoroseomonas alba]
MRHSAPTRAEDPGRDASDARESGVPEAFDQSEFRFWNAGALAASDADGVQVARSGAALTGIGRLRYAMFIAQAGKKYPSADTVAGTFIDPVDRYSLNLHVTRAGRCLVGCRLTRAEPALADPQLAALAAHAGLAASSLPAIAFNSRLVLASGFGARAWLVPIFRHLYRIGVLSGLAWSVAGTRPALFPLFERFGFRPTGEVYQDPVAGPLQPMMLDSRDRAHMVRVNSPLLAEHDRIFGHRASRPTPPIPEPLR